MRAGTGERIVQRTPGYHKHPTLFYLAHVRRQDRAGGEQSAIRRSPATGRGSVRFTHLSERRAWDGAWSSSIQPGRPFKAPSLDRRLHLLVETTGIRELKLTKNCRTEITGARIKTGFTSSPADHRRRIRRKPPIRRNWDIVQHRSRANGENLSRHHSRYRDGCQPPNPLFPCHKESADTPVNQYCRF